MRRLRALWDTLTRPSAAPDGPPASPAEPPAVAQASPAEPSQAAPALPPEEPPGAPAPPVEPTPPAPGAFSGINPADVIEKFTVEDLSATAENYFRSIADALPQMSKPFSNLLESPQILESMGLLLAGLQLGKTMTVLEFGAGTCWFSRYLNQLQCRTISCDVSRTALDIGRRLFREFPIVGAPISEPVFLHFDGHKIDLPDESVDRIVCHDAFHHVPNQEEVISELGRVLKSGGIAGFAEPGRFHSRAPHSQYEMANYDVLENDIVPADIFAIARKHGFDDMRLKVLCDMEVSVSQSVALTDGAADQDLVELVRQNIGTTMNNRTVFFLYKGRVVPDSRSHLGLGHSISVGGGSAFQVATGDELRLSLAIVNTGSARWIIENVHDIGVVKVGTHLYAASGKLLDLDFSRHYFSRPIEPGETVSRDIALTFRDPGVYRVAIDLVSEGICWFENVGATPQSVTVEVSGA